MVVLLPRKATRWKPTILSTQDFPRRRRCRVEAKTSVNDHSAGEVGDGACNGGGLVRREECRGLPKLEQRGGPFAMSRIGHGGREVVTRCLMCVGMQPVNDIDSFCFPYPGGAQAHGAHPMGLPTLPRWRD
ncbi:MAG: hypothetical protein QOH94_1126 [Mycobacterium sp.]|nr:hypothetical protein [Mycobacterium sp.]